MERRLEKWRDREKNEADRKEDRVRGKMVTQREVLFGSLALQK